MKLHQRTPDARKAYLEGHIAGIEYAIGQMGKTYSSTLVNVIAHLRSHIAGMRVLMTTEAEDVARQD